MANDPNIEQYNFILFPLNSHQCHHKIVRKYLKWTNWRDRLELFWHVLASVEYKHLRKEPLLYLFKIFAKLACERATKVPFLTHTMLFNPLPEYLYLHRKLNFGLQPYINPTWKFIQKIRIMSPPKSIKYEVLNNNFLIHMTFLTIMLLYLIFQTSQRKVI